MLRRRWGNVMLGAIGLGVIAAVALVVSVGTHLPYAWTFLLVAAAFTINGFLATLEDDLPGGLNNPDGTATPRYARVLSVVGKWSLVAFLLLVALGTVLGLPGSAGPRALGVALAAAAGLLCVALLWKRRWAVWAAAAILVAGLGGAVVAK